MHFENTKSLIEELKKNPNLNGKLAENLAISIASHFAIKCHGHQRYGDKPYFYHLEAVAKILEPYGVDAIILGWLHDVLEDCKDITFEEIEKEFGTFIAECVKLLTDEPGVNRKERKEKTNLKLSKVEGKHELALIVKAADRLANVSERSKLDMYRKEHDEFRKAVYRKGLCDDIWNELDKIIYDVYTVIDDEGNEVRVKKVKHLWDERPSARK